MNKNNEKYDVAVIGGGPAGMMAAGVAAQEGAKVVLLEKNRSLGKKLLITGKGRCNFTQAKLDNQKIVDDFRPNGKFLFSSLASFGPDEIIQFFKEKGLPSKTERGGRVFPVSDKSIEVLAVLEKFLKENGVKVIFQSQIQKFEHKGNKINCIKTNKENIYAKKYIIATGGKSYPGTGSTGDGYLFSEKLGHAIIPPSPALVPVKTKESWVKKAQGVSLRNVNITLLQNGKKKDSRFGEMLFTHFGLSGPIILDISKKVSQLQANGEVMISIDLKPALSLERLDTRLQRDIEEFGKKDIVNYLPNLLPQKLASAIVDLLEIDSRKKVSSIGRIERKGIANLLKDLRLTVSGLGDFGQAIVTAGGIDLKEVDSKTMRSKKINNLFFAGEVLNLDGPTGGYNLQICWSTGFAAGTHAAKQLKVS